MAVHWRTRNLSVLRFPCVVLLLVGLVGASTVAFADEPVPPTPTFGVNPETDQVWGNDWPAESPLLFEVHDPTAAESDPAPPALSLSTETDARGSFFLEGVYDFVAGQTVTVAFDKDGNNEIVGVHTITDLRDLWTDPAADTVSGSAQPGSEVIVQVLADVDGWTPVRRAVTNESGEWSVDFSAPGDSEEDAYKQIVDLKRGDGGSAHQYDEDGDEHPRLARHQRPGARRPGGELGMGSRVAWRRDPDRRGQRRDDGRRRPDPG
jgi:hypothetical protein